MEKVGRRTGEPSGHNANLTRGGNFEGDILDVHESKDGLQGYQGVPEPALAVKGCHCLPGRVCLIILTLLSCLLGVAPEKLCPLCPTGFQNAVAGVLVSYARCPLKSEDMIERKRDTFLSLFQGKVLFYDFSRS